MSTKRPTIRRGQRRPYFKATRREVQQRIKAVVWLETCFVCEPLIVYEFFDEVFGIGTRQTARYLALSRTREACKRQAPGGDET